ncbi:YxeA family protein [uncultured Vagococcus sp.]|uniref:YxeA family protein n=1 Tax=uncultured Vagococcus sp. TaxID=189676 RepID=UPI0028D4CA2B|nr:YxeA family protein [uncultured Vagococcus sp.]
MKVIKLVIVMAVLAVGVFVVGGALAPEKQTSDNDIAQQLDRFNPFVSQEAVYLMTDSQHGEKQGQGGVIYYQDVYKEDGSSYKLSFFAGNELREGAFLKLEAKGKYVKSWEEVQPGDLPAKVSEKLISTN